MGILNASKWFKTKSQGVGWIAVGIEKHGIHLAQISLAGSMPRVELCEYHAGEVSVAALEKICRRVNDGLHGFTTLLNAGDYQLLLVDAPNVPSNELKTAIRWKIKDGLNFHIDDATVDVLQIPTNQYGSERAKSMYAIAAANVIIEKRIALFEQAKLGLNVIDIPELAQRNIAALYEQDGRALVLISFDDEGGLLTFTAGGELFMSRRFDISAGQLQDADENLRQQHRGRVELELQRSLDYFDRQYNHLPVSRVLVSVPTDSDLVSSLAEAIDIKVEKLELSQVMDISRVPALADTVFVAHALTTLGAALRQEERVL